MEGAMKRALPAVAFVLLLIAPVAVGAQELPELTQPINDFAHVIDSAHAESMDRTIRALQSATGDAIVVATVPTFEPYGSLEQYANKLFQNRGRGIGEKGKDNGLLIVVAVKEHRVWNEVGYGLEPYITDGFAGETSRLYMIPEFRRDDYGAGLEAGVQRFAGRIAEARGVTLEGVPKPAPAARRHRGTSGLGVLAFIVLFIVISAVSSLFNSFRGPRRWTRTGWRSGVGPFGGGWGGFGGGFGGFGGGFGGGGGGGWGGFGGGSSGGGGGGGSW